MFQLFDLILASVGGIIFGSLRETVYVAMIVSDCEECGFNDLGKLLFGGLVLAILLGVGGSLLWRRMREKQDSRSAFVTIKSNEPRS